ncbi:hypothetical protein D0T50_04545 [Bacteroides sp. 214]|uniref:pectinesterase family protein n=1 Tax=Bacteroides sp. 214 TaxID=2302935 RepID=UPI0013D69F7D|nr:pectinesterase family protein [Bacteroides sp. 214]NDW12159.1 hypothetical protein [Bacteroides sp. 214]
MKNIYKRLSVVALASATLMSAWAASGDPVAIPTTAGEYINWGDATITAAKVENDGANIGSTGESTIIVFNLANSKAGDYTMTLSTGHKESATATINLAIADASGAALYNGTHSVIGTGSWSNFSQTSTHIIKNLPAGNLTLTMSVSDLTGNKYAGNWSKLAIYEGIVDNRDHIPGTLSLDKGIYSHGQMNEGTNIGWITDGRHASYDFVCDEAGVYEMSWEIARYASDKVRITVTDKATRDEELDMVWDLTDDIPGDYTLKSFNLEGEISEGEKTIKYLFYSESGNTSFICNYKALSFKKIAEHAASVKSVTIEGQTVAKGDGYDWACVLPESYSAATTTLDIKSVWSTIAVSAKNGEENVAVTNKGNGLFELPTPAAGAETIVTINVTADAASGAMLFKEAYTVRLFRIGDVEIATLSIGGQSAGETIINTLNGAGATASLTGNIYTALPEVKATFLDGSTATGEGTISGTTATYKFTGKSGEKSKEFTLNVEGIHIYAPSDKDESFSIRFDGALNQPDGSWSDGSYTFTGTNGFDGWGGTQFKFKTNTDYTLSVPSDVVLKQVKFVGLYDNYAAGAVGTFKAEGATVYLPTNRSFKSGGPGYELIVNIEGNTAGNPIVFNFASGSQPVAWFDLVYEKVSLTSEPKLNSTSSTSTEHKNHAVVTLNFDRKMKDMEATINGKTVKAEGGSSSVRFALWDLPYNTKSSLVIAAGAAQDTYGNVNAAPISVDVVVGSEEVVEAIGTGNLYIVSTVAEWKEAIAAVNASNTKTDSPRKVIFVRNGDYDFGSEEQTLRAHNVSIIGESQTDVLIHGKREGISNPVFSTRNATNTYMQDFTVRNDFNFGTDNYRGVAVAHYGGKKDIMKNMILQSYQDTQVTGESGYYEDCTIHGTVDFICGGGEHFYNNCDLIVEDAGAIAAPATSASHKHGYVFQNCTISGKSGYTLGRPWQNEPKAFFLNTTMEALPTDAGWGSMGNLPTYFFEYNSMDTEGKAIDLSKRTNSPTSTNQYSPILPAEYADYFTVRNVLCGTDSWSPVEGAETMDAPIEVKIDGNGTITWTPVANALYYAIYSNDALVEIVAGNSYDTKQAVVRAEGDPAYTVRAANPLGGLGKTSLAASPVTGIKDVVASEVVSVRYYNLQGVVVDKVSKGIYIKVSKLSDGSEKAEKVIF